MHSGDLLELCERKSAIDSDYEAFLRSSGVTVEENCNDSDGVESVFGKDWREKVYSASEQLASDAFVEYDPEWTLVSHGERKDENCGSFKRRKTKTLYGCLRLHLHNEVGLRLDGVDCRNKVAVKRAFYSCHRPECPSCGITSWAVREASRAEQRLKYFEDKMGVRFEHGIVSLPLGLKGSFEDMKRYALRAVLRRGFEGGLFIYHHFRYHGRDERYVGERAHYLKGPHFHFLSYLRGGYGNCRTCAHNPEKCGNWDKCKGCNGFEGVTRRAYEKDGVIVKIKDARKTLGGSVWYELSHASIRKGAKKQVVVNWFGTLGRNRLQIPKGSLPQRENLCEICHQPLYEIKYAGDMAELLRYMSGFKDSESFMLNAKDEAGNWLWATVYDGG